LAAVRVRGYGRAVRGEGPGVTLGSADDVRALAAYVERWSAEKGVTRARLVLASSPARLASVARVLEGLVGAAAASRAPAAAGVPYELARLRLAEGVDLELMALPAFESFAPLWPLVLEGSLGAISLEPQAGRALRSECEGLGVGLLEAEPDEGGSGGPVHNIARLLRAAIERFGLG
jgi:hypothetical protein